MIFSKNCFKYEVPAHESFRQCYKETAYPFLGVHSRVLSGVKIFGGNLHIYLYVRMYIHTCVARRGVAWHKHDVVYSMILKPHSCMQHAYQVFFQNND